MRDGMEWVEHPAGSQEWFYRDPSTQQWIHRNEASKIEFGLVLKFNAH
ncbi:MAG: hypothetical protein ACPH54_06135 [Candidatus Poseidoniaceae archaeon]